MRDLLILAIHLLVTFLKLVRPGGLRAVVAESLLLRHQILISKRSRRRAPNLTTVVRNNSRRVCFRVKRLQPRAASGMMSTCCSWRDRSSE